MRCSQCRDALNRDSKNLASEIEASFPDCECEQYSVGHNSPGRIEDDEILYRMFVDPVDVDKGSGQLAREAFRTAHIDGLSIVRERAEDAHIEALASDILSIKRGGKPKTILAIFRFVCGKIRSEMTTIQAQAEKAFCVYDQTQPRILLPAETAVPTHGIVISRRLYEPPITKGQFERDCNLTLYRIISAEAVSVENFRAGLIEKLNARSLAGDFVRG
jgi:hypothetical protein